MGYTGRRDTQFDPATDGAGPDNNSDDNSGWGVDDLITAPAPTRRRLSRLAARRLIGVGVLVGMAVGLYWAIFCAELLAPVLAYVGPARDLIDWVAADPKRAWGALAVLVIPHIGLYYMLFDDRSR